VFFLHSALLRLGPSARNCGPQVISRARLCALILLAASVVSIGPPDASGDPPDPTSRGQKSVLILLTGQPGLPASSAIAAGIRSKIVSVWSTRVAIETEHVDVARFKGTDYEHHLRALYQFKYAGRPFDAIVVAGNEPLGFLLRARDDLWPGTPIIVCAVDERTLGGFTAPPDTTVVTVTYDMEGTLRAALALLPDTRHVALIGGASVEDQSFNELGRQAVRVFGERLRLIDLTGLALDEMLARLSVLPSKTIVLASSIRVDGAGRRFYGVEVVGSLSATANRPLFALFGTVMGLGTVGGSMVDFEAVGREAGALTLRTLRGEPMPGAFLRSAASNTPLFDWRQLRRWNLDERRLPAGSRVLYRQPSFWEQYRWHIAATLVVVAAQASLIVGLLIERQRRRRAQAGLSERLHFETLVASISATFAALPTGRVDEHIRDCLRRIVLFIGADRGTLWQPSADGQAVSATHSWTAEGVSPAPSTIRTGAFPMFWPLTEQGQPLSVASLDELPPAAHAERQALQKLGVKSLLALPLRIGDRTLGVLAFSSLRAERSWPAELVQRLQTLAELVANALMRRQEATALEVSEALTASVLATLPGDAAIVDVSGVIVQVNDAWAVSARADEPDPLAAVSVGANYLDACKRGIATSDETARAALRLLESVLDGHSDEGMVEYALRGEDRWFEMRVQHLVGPEGGAAIMHFDISARKRAEAEARRHLDEIAHMDRVAALGELASALAHELNQPLTAILTNAQAAHRFLAATPPDLDELRECLEDIMQNDRRAGEVIRRMRPLLKKGGPAEPLPLNLNDLVKNVLALISNDALLHRVSIEAVPDPSLPVVYGDGIQIQQVILNLLVNAISAAATGPPANRKVIVWTAAGDAHADLSVHDSGKGISETNLERVFEPFFTTKQEGLGMGLAISRSIVQAHQGRIWGENDPAGGAIFRVRLPTERGAVVRAASDR
jgi:C4-dicarboxylate-specific signal transduction histidine kinase